MLQRIDSKEIGEWIAFNSLEPIAYRGDLQAGIIASTIANAHRGRDGQPFQPIDFMPLLDKPEQTEDEMKAILTTMVKDK
jgi:hypothetical protein